MQLDKENHKQNYKIQGYTATSLIINEKSYSEPLILNEKNLHPLKEPHFEINIIATQLIEYLPKSLDLVLLTASTLSSELIKLKYQMLQSGYILEIMPLKACCYTYTALSNDGGSVALIFLPQLLEKYAEKK